MTFLVRFIIAFTLFSSSPMIIQANEIKYNHNCQSISEIQKKVDFTVLVPENIPHDWTLDTKTTLGVSLHYMDSKDTVMMVGIDQRLGFSSYDDDVSPTAEQVDINGNKGYFQQWDDSGEGAHDGEIITGGLLFWIQEGTYIEMNSSKLSKEKMLEIARTMK